MIHLHKFKLRLIHKIVFEKCCQGCVQKLLLHSPFCPKYYDGTISTITVLKCQQEKEQYYYICSEYQNSPVQWRIIYVH